MAQPSGDRSMEVREDTPSNLHAAERLTNGNRPFSEGRCSVYSRTPGWLRGESRMRDGVRLITRLSLYRFDLSDKATDKPHLHPRWNRFEMDVPCHLSRGRSRPIYRSPARSSSKFARPTTRIAVMVVTPRVPRSTKTMAMNSLAIGSV